MRVIGVIRWVCKCEWDVVHVEHRLELDWLDREGAAVLGVDSSGPSRPTTTLNVDAVVEFGEFGSATETGTLAKSVVAGLEHGRLVDDEVLVFWCCE